MRGRAEHISGGAAASELGQLTTKSYWNLSTPPPPPPPLHVMFGMLLMPPTEQALRYTELMSVPILTGAPRCAAAASSDPPPQNGSRTTLSLRTPANEADTSASRGPIPVGVALPLLWWASFLRPHATTTPRTAAEEASVGSPGLGSPVIRMAASTGAPGLGSVPRPARRQACSSILERPRGTSTNKGVESHHQGGSVRTQACLMGKDPAIGT